MCKVRTAKVCPEEPGELALWLGKPKQSGIIGVQNCLRSNWVFWAPCSYSIPSNGRLHRLAGIAA